MSPKFKESKKAEIGNLMNKLATMKYDGVKDLGVYHLSMIEVASKVKALDFPITDPFLVHLALNSIPSSYGHLKVNYNAKKDKWDLNEMISFYVHEEARIKKEKEANTSHLTTNAHKQQHFKPSSHVVANKDNTKANPPPKSYNPLNSNKTTTFKCYFCDKAGHLKRDCTRYKRWVRRTKGN